jgi:uncharacterized membrane protein YqjE
MPNPVRTLLGSATGFAHSRLALLGTELREELGRFAFLLLGGCAAIVLAALGLAVTAAALIIAAGETHRLAAAFVLAALFIAAALVAAVRVRNILAAKSSALAASLAELERDREALIERSRESRSELAESGAELARLVSLGVLGYTIGRRLRRAA